MPKEDIKIIYEDKDILAVNKPAGLLVHLDPKKKRKDEETLVGWLIEKYSGIKEVGDDPELRPGIVHRLDKETSGVLVIAKNQEAFERLKSQFQKREVKKEYLALVRGVLKEPSGVIDLPIGKSKKDFRKKTSLGKMAGKVREAVTEYEVVKRFGGYTLVKVFPKTGRTHQIRVHFKAIGHPVVCDKLYGPKKQDCLGLQRHFLHASSLEIALPSGGRIKLEADLPDDLQKVLKSLEQEENGTQ